MTSDERREVRYQRRKQRRLERKIQRSNDIGQLQDVFRYSDFYKTGKKCCNGVRWKNSTQKFELHLFSGTAKRRQLILESSWEPHKYVHFIISERGKTRPIDAPRIEDRQIHKSLTKNVLLPLYLPEMIWNNGASLPKKGFRFSQEEMKKDLRSHYRKYGREGNIILIDFKQFFPSAPHRPIYDRHDKLIFDDKIKALADSVVSNVQDKKGMPLGVEPSQAEMIALPSSIDNYIKCQLSIKHAGHYMDDYYIIVPPKLDAKVIMGLIINKAEGVGLMINTNKSRIVSLSKQYKYCKATYRFTETGHVIVNGSRGNVKRARGKIKSFKKKVDSGEMSYDDLWTSINGSLAYFRNYNDHGRVLRLRRLFYSIYGFSTEHIENFRKMEKIRCNTLHTEDLKEARYADK